MLLSRKKESKPENKPAETASSPGAFLMIYMVCANADEAKNIIMHLLDNRLAACANTFALQKSYFRWDGKLAESEEVAVILKTRKQLYKRVEEAIARMHSYKCPCIVALPVESGYAPFMQWVVQETSF